jgi:hypothetical protein
MEQREQMEQKCNRKYAHNVIMTCGLWDSYKDFKREFKHVYNIDRKTYVTICHEINTALSDKIIKESFEVKLPSRLGTLSIKKTKSKVKIKDGKLERNKMIIDWKKTWDYWAKEYPGKTRKEINDIKDKVVIYNMNEHTNGYIMGWVWDKTTSNVVNKSVYSFRPVKYNRLNLAKWINSDERENDYYLTNKFYGSKRGRYTKIKQEAVLDEACC